ncbi:hypothetical protein MXD81_24960, partial [Microbacteriaceae bacterium K1510]|nr:hypothetical protein [Microbacteriaceae bacterium K1510]
NMIFGAVINEDLKNEIIVTVIATGFEENQRQSNGARRPQQQMASAARPTQQSGSPAATNRTREEEQEKSTFSMSNLDNLDIPA